MSERESLMRDEGGRRRSKHDPPPLAERRGLWWMSFLGKAVFLLFWTAVGILAWTLAIPGWKIDNFDHHTYFLAFAFVGGGILIYDVVFGLVFVYYDVGSARNNPGFFRSKTTVLVYEAFYFLSFCVALSFLWAYDDRAEHYFKSKDYLEADPSRFVQRQEYLMTYWSAAVASVYSFLASTIAVAHYVGLYV